MIMLIACACIFMAISTSVFVMLFRGGSPDTYAGINQDEKTHDKE